MRHSSGDTVDESDRSAVPVLLNVVAGFLVGGLIGYVAAFVLPRRSRPGQLGYQAPIPPSHDESSSAILDLLAQRVAEGAG